MCGIFGRLGAGPPLNPDPVARAHQALHHRGPDDRGWEQGEGFDLGFNRLSILDLSSSGHQPMWDATNRYCLVFNGEIFNYQELQQQYLPSMSWRSSSDTEVLLQLLIHKREAALPLLNGMFAFCWLDSLTGEYIMARDRLGIKPLYYTHWQGNTYFASELKALRAICPRPYVVNEMAVLDYMGSGYIAGPLSIYQEVCKFPIAHYNHGDFRQPGSFKARPYWQLEITEDYKGSYQQCLEELDALLQDAVRLRLRSDVALGVFLSGGVDSGLVAALAARKQEIDCYTISFPGAANDESEMARQTAAHIGAHWHPIEMKGLDSISLADLAYYYDEPFADSSALPSYAICQAASRSATVFLTGDAGDEAFAGYKRYIKSIRQERILKNLSAFSHIPGLHALIPLRHRSKLDLLQSSSLFREAYPDDLPNSWYYQQLMPSKVYRKFLVHHEEKVLGFYRYNNLTSNQQYYDYGYYLPDDILVKMDRASMANSIEVRSPFLDYRIHELAARLPRSWLIDAQGGKKILRDLARRYLPPKVVQAKKAGFGIPLQSWTSHPDFHASAIVSMANSEMLNLLINSDQAQKLMQYQLRSSVNLGSLLWKLTMLAQWESKTNPRGA